MRDRICVGIESRRLLSLSFESWSHVVEPHAYGQSVDGPEVLRAFQVSGEGEGEDGSAVGWQLYHVDRISSIDVLDATFLGVRPGYRRNDPSFRALYCQL